MCGWSPNLRPQLFLDTSHKHPCVSVFSSMWFECYFLSARWLYLTGMTKTLWKKKKIRKFQAVKLCDHRQLTEAQLEELFFLTIGQQTVTHQSSVSQWEPAAQEIYWALPFWEVRWNVGPHVSESLSCTLWGGGVKGGLHKYGPCSAVETLAGLCSLTAA